MSVEDRKTMGGVKQVCNLLRLWVSFKIVCKGTFFSSFKQIFQ